MDGVEEMIGTENEVELKLKAKYKRDVTLSRKPATALFRNGNASAKMRPRRKFHSVSYHRNLPRQSLGKDLNPLDGSDNFPFPPCQNAGVTQLVECNLAKVDVASSSLVTRSFFMYQQYQQLR